MKKKLWEFIDDDGSFESEAAGDVRTLYFPLANEALMSSITPDLHGDAKAGQDAFLYAPVSRIDLVNSRSSRNMWVRMAGGATWSATGVSKDLKQIRADSFRLTAGLLWHRLERKNRSVGLKADILSFIPSSGDPVEITSITFTNISPRQVSFTPTAAMPIYARSAENIRDHRHVTSLLNRISQGRYGVTVKPTLLFSEAGHLVNKNTCFVLGCDGSGNAPEYIYPTQEMFCGEGGDLEAPEAVLALTLPAKQRIQGREAFGGLRFRKVALRPGESKTYIILAGIVEDPSAVERIFAAYGSTAGVEAAFALTQEFWTAKADDYRVRTGDADFNNWFRWVSIQPTLRRVFGCSFLPDFDYGKGGRGWRDLWQDCLGLLLSEPGHVRELLLNNFSGVRIDGSNATIIGTLPGEFISDRNNVSRVWMDHGVWPLLTLELYMDETGDLGVLSEKVAYFRNHERSRSRVIDREWKLSDGQRLTAASGEVYEGTVFEHLLVQNLTQFYNVGSHNHVRLEGADWNDGLDMAKQHGESVAFSAMYARNLAALAGVLAKAGWREVELAKEISLLLRKCDYENTGAKHEVLNDYFHATNHGISGEKTRMDASRLAEDLAGKAAWMMEYIRKTEWLDEGFFNGYYDNKRRRVEGRRGKDMRMALTSQVFPIMSCTATDAQVRAAYRSARRYLLDKKLGGYRLNTDLGGEQHDLGRAFSFAYGDKENGAFFNHMAVMFAYGLYKRGFVDEGWGVLSSIYAMALDTKSSRIYPCLPEYYDLEGRGMYSYLTGSASWFVLTIVTEVFGLKGERGDLRIEPKLSREQFRRSSVISVDRVFAGKRFTVNFSNHAKKPWGSYAVSTVWLDGREIGRTEKGAVIISRGVIDGLSPDRRHMIDITLG